VNSGGMDLTMIRGAIERQPPFYKGIGGIEMGPDILRQRFTAVFLDAEWNVGRASVMFEAWRCW
jgi:hypothetical protein